MAATISSTPLSLLQMLTITANHHRHWGGLEFVKKIELLIDEERKKKELANAANNTRAHTHKTAAEQISLYL